MVQPMGADEGELLRAAQQGDDDAFGRLIRPYLDPAYRLAVRILGDTAEAEDAVQEALFKAWRALPASAVTRSFLLGCTESCGGSQCTVPSAKSNSRWILKSPLSWDCRWERSRPISIAPATHCGGSWHRRSRRNRCLAKPILNRG